MKRSPEKVSPESIYTKCKLFNKVLYLKTAAWLQLVIPGFCATWQSYKMPFHLCALHNPNPLELVFSRHQTPQQSVQHLVVCLDEYFQKLLFLYENIQRGGCLWLCLLDIVFAFAKPELKTCVHLDIKHMCVGGGCWHWWRWVAIIVFIIILALICNQ